MDPSAIRAICTRLTANKPVRRTLPAGGRLHIDRQLPFLCVYRSRKSDPGTERLIMGEASYLVVPGATHHRQWVSALVLEIVKTLSAQFGSFLIFEIWSGSDESRANDPANPFESPIFQIVVSRSSSLSKSVDTLARGLRKIKVLKQTVDVEVIRDRKCGPPGMRSLLNRQERLEQNCSILGLVVPTVYRNLEAGQEFPLLLGRFRRALSQALRPTFHRFSLTHTTHRPPHYHQLGRRAVVKAVWEVDRRLSQISNVFDFLLEVSPVNSDDAWNEFKRSDFEQSPKLHYRPIPYDPVLLKRQLYRIPIEGVEDPALQHLLQEKQDELGRKITMLQDRDTPRFIYGGLQLYGAVGESLFKLATDLLERVPARSRDESRTGQLGAKAFAGKALAQFEQYRAVYPEFSAKARVTGEVAGLMVSRGTLLINPKTRIPVSRVDPLLHHEVGTHLLTYFNGRAQPFQQLCSGLAGYEELQEGLAVLAEYLVGGLTRPRMRQLAARVVASRHLIDGASFVETFRGLDRNYEFSQKSAFTITLRIYRGGGFIKDAIYLRGLVWILKYLNRGGELDPLFAGKIAADHIPIIEELQHRKVLKPAPLQPLYLRDSAAKQRLAELQRGRATISTVIDAIAGKGRPSQPEARQPD